MSGACWTKTNGKCVLRDDFSSPTPSGLFRVDYCPDHFRIADNHAILTMDQTCGTRLTSNSLHTEGYFEARLRASASGVTAFILRSDDGATSDEIDVEIVGKNLHSFQTNLFVNGALNYTNVRYHTTPMDLSRDFHVYGIYWSPVILKWYFDGKLFRAQNRSALSAYPVKPSRVQLGIWVSG